jgi:general secretion pathway protein G
MMVRLAGRRVAGFSFIELLASAAILGLLATIAVPFVETTVKRQKEHDLRIALRDIRQAIDAYKLAAADADGVAASGYPHDLTELVSGVVFKSKVDSTLSAPQYFLRRIPRDPFYPDASVSAVDSWGKRSFASDADSPQAGDDVFDVYSTSTQTGLNGVPYAAW